mmetsp:Transcript_1257/g.2084  ORF Transcript_1257/g.2084 Transcript_1257/m.2084 type:complete len:240 (+) Transcript_1257:1062-1781(+)
MTRNEHALALPGSNLHLCGLLLAVLGVALVKEVHGPQVGLSAAQAHVEGLSEVVPLLTDEESVCLVQESVDLGILLVQHGSVIGVGGNALDSVNQHLAERGCIRIRSLLTLLDDGNGRQGRGRHISSLSLQTVNHSPRLGQHLVETLGIVVHVGKGGEGGQQAEPVHLVGHFLALGEDRVGVVSELLHALHDLVLLFGNIRRLVAVAHGSSAVRVVLLALSAEHLGSLHPLHGSHERHS